MRNRFDRELEVLNNELIEMGSMVEYAIEIAVKALLEKDENLAKKAIEFDEHIDEKEKDIERRCLKLILQQQPVATDLRLISTALKMITDMERIGDQAADISELTILFKGAEYIKKLEHIEMMANETIKMVKDSIDAFVKRDLELALDVIKRDDIVDELFVTVKNDLIEMIHRDVKNGQQAMDLIIIAKYFERIGDHATNIAEWVEFSITGRHKNERIF